MAIEEPDKDTAEDPIAVLGKRLGRWQLAAYASLVLCCLLVGIAIVMVIYTGSRSLDALRDLPGYQVNSLLKDYQLSVETFETSRATTQAMLEDEPASEVLRGARRLPRRVLEQEQAFAAALAAYGQAVRAAAQDIGGAREWNRYYQAELAAQREASRDRQAAIQAFLDEFPPAPPVPEPESDPEASGEPETATETGSL